MKYQITQHLNPKRHKHYSGMRFFLVSLFTKLGFKHIDFYYVHGSSSENSNKLILGDRVSVMDALFNISSGSIYIGDDTIFGHGVMLLTGKHRFENGKLAKLGGSMMKEVPDFGCDIEIGSGVYIGSGAIILGNVKIGDNAIVGAGTIVTRDVPSGSKCYGQAGNLS